MKLSPGTSEAFRGITTTNGTDLADYLDNMLPGRTRVPLAFPTLEQIAQRILELQEIVSQDALTASDLPQAGWGLPLQPDEEGT